MKKSIFFIVFALFTLIRVNSQVLVNNDNQHIYPIQKNNLTVFEESPKKAHILEDDISKGLVNYMDDSLAIENPISPTDPYQSYLNIAPEGIGSKYVWDSSIAGSDGAGIKFMNIGTGWTLDHEDLITHGINCVYGTNQDAGRAHGTGILGIVCAYDNTVGCVGIAPNLAKVEVIAHDTTDLAETILKSLNYLNYGDVLLLDFTNTETYGGTDCEVPIETSDSLYNAINLATALGIIVVESGGNGNGTTIPVNFNNYKKGGDGGTEEILNPSNTTYFRESGAIIVSASKSTTSSISGYESTHNIMPWAPFGERVDCYAWGENITTLLSDASGADNLYINDFQGTSGAAAIISGAVINMQGMVLAEHGYKFSPLQIRKILRNSVYGTQLIREMDDPMMPVEEILSYMPDLQKFADHLLNLPPDLYLRDNIDDTGEPHSGLISVSPDIILKNNPVVDPTLSFGQGSGLENNDDLCDTALINKTNYIYIRLMNQGGTDATDVKVDIYYTTPSNLVSPSLLNYIGEITIPDVPEGEILTVSNALEWIPTEAIGHYSIVALVSHNMDPVLDPKKLNDWDMEKFNRYIRENNNITWKNFLMVDELSSPNVIISSTAPNPTNNAFEILVEFNENVLNFTIDDIIAENGGFSDFTKINDSTFTVNVDPESNGSVIVKVNAGVCNDLSGNSNNESNIFEIEFDNTKPNVVITSTENSPTVNNSITLTIAFSELVSGFDISDINVINGSVSGLSNTNNIFTTTLIPISSGSVTVDISEGVLTDMAGNNNTSSNQFSIIYNSTVGINQLSGYKFSIYSLDKKVIIDFSNNENKQFQNAQIEIMNVLGVCIVKKTIDNHSYITIPIGDQSNVLIVKLSIDGEIFTQKIFIN